MCAAYKQHLQLTHETFLQVHARAHLPNLDEKGGMHLECVDTFGHKHRFRYCSWINNSSRMYLLEGVAPALVRLCPIYLHVPCMGLHWPTCMHAQCMARACK